MRSPGTPGPPSGFHAGLCAHVSAPVSVSENYSGQASPSLYAPVSLCLRLQPSPPSPSQALLPLLGATWSTPRSPSPPEPSADRGPSQAFPRPKPAGFHVCLGGGSTPWKAKPQKAWVLLSGLPQHWGPGSALPRRAPAPGAEGAVSVFPRWRWREPFLQALWAAYQPCPTPYARACPHQTEADWKPLPCGARPGPLHSSRL